MIVTAIAEKLAGKPARDQITALQFLRGVAASLVVVSHLLLRYVRRDVFPSGLPEWVSRTGHVGVLVFFAISGFIMVYTTTRDGERKVGSLEFFKNRFLRIAPLYYLTTVLMVVFQMMTNSMSTQDGYHQPELLDWILSFLFIPFNNLDGTLQPIYTLGWSLNCEMFFYVLFALSLAFRSRTLGIWIMVLFLCGLVAAGMAIPEPHGRYGLDVVVFFLTRPILLYFALGMLLGLARRHLADERRPAVSTPIQSLIATGAVVLALVGGPVVSFLAVGVAISAVTLLRETRAEPALFGLFARTFGDISYSMYLTHSFLLGAFAAVTARFVPWGLAPLSLLLLAACGMCSVFAWITWRTIETPLTRLLRGKPLRRAELVAP